jgi:four helix bundle protein
MSNEEKIVELGLGKLIAWQKALDLTVMVCKDVLPILPVEEKYALSAQLRRSAQSIPANIAEGYGRFYYQDNVRFCYIARGSLEETRSHIQLAHRLGYLTNDQLTPVIQLSEEVRRLINGYIAHLKLRKPGSNEPGAAIHEDGAVYLADLDE